MAEIQEAFVAEARKFAEIPNATVVLDAVTLFPVLTDAELTELINRVLILKDEIALAPDETLDVLYQYVLKDEMGEQNTPSEQEQRIRYVIGLTRDQFRDFVHTCSVHDF